MKKKFWIAGLLLAAMTMTYGCGSKKAEEESTQAESASEETASESGAENGSGAAEADSADNTDSSEEQGTAEGSIEETEQVRTGRAVVDIPEGFKEYLPPSGIYVSSKYPTDGSNIYILTTALYGDFPSERDYTNEINDSLSSQTGRTVSIKMEEYSEDTLEGCPMLKAVFTYSYDGMKFRRTEYTVNTDITTVIAYTQVDNADWNDEFEESAFSMRIEQE